METPFSNIRPAICPLQLIVAVLAAALISILPASGELKLLRVWPTGGNACVDSPLRITFDQQPVPGNDGKIEICRVVDGQTVDTIRFGPAAYSDTFGGNGGPVLRCDPLTIDGTTVSIRPHTGCLKYGESYFVRMDSGSFEGFPGLSGEWKFQIKPALPRNPDRLMVALDGSGDFCTVQGAIDQIDAHRTREAVIAIRKGRYQELIRVGREKRFIRLIGESRKETVISRTNNENLNPGWIRRSVIGVEADDFTIENLTVRNTTPYKGSQAEALCVNGERCTVRNADFFSTQDTLHLSGSVRVTDCYIEGDVDYVWGYGSAFFERCELRSLHDGYLVQARNPAGKPGYVFVDCNLTAGPETKRTWLARIETNRFPDSQVAFIRCRMGGHIPPEGWLATGPECPTLRFQEFASTSADGKPLDTGRRAAFSSPLSENDAAALSDPGKFLSWPDGKTKPR